MQTEFPIVQDCNVQNGVIAKKEPNQKIIFWNGRNFQIIHALFRPSFSVLLCDETNTFKTVQDPQYSGLFSTIRFIDPPNLFTKIPPELISIIAASFSLSDCSSFVQTCKMMANQHAIIFKKHEIRVVQFLQLASSRSLRVYQHSKEELGQTLPFREEHWPVLPYFRNVKKFRPSVNFAMTKLLPKDLWSVSKKLEFLDLSDCFEVSDEIVIAMVKGNTHLESLNLSFQDKITDDLFDKISKEIENLHALSLNFCQHITEKSLSFIAMHCKNLKYLSCNMSGFSQNKELLYEICKNNPGIRKLHLDAWDELRGSDILELSSHCPHLEELTLSEQKDISLVEFLEFLKACPNVNYIDFTWFSEIPFYFAEQVLKASNLKTVILLKPLVSFTAPMKLLKNSFQTMEELYIDLVDEQELVDFLYLSPPLKKLFIKDGQGITDKTLVALSEHCPMLEALFIGKAGQCTDVGIKMLSTSLKNLLHLTLPTERFSQRGYEHMGKFFHIQTLELFHSQITDEIAQNLSSSLPQLLHLKCFYDSKLSDIGMQFFLDNCTFLQTISLPSCNSVSFSMKKNLQMRETEFDDEGFSTLKRLCFDRFAKEVYDAHMTSHSRLMSFNTCLIS